MNTKQIEKNEAKNAIGMSREILAGSQDINNVLTTSKVTRAVFHTHYVSMDASLFGIADLITSILREAQAVFPKGVEATELRGVALSASLTTEEIMSAVERKFTAGSIRYPLQTVKSYLSVFMSKGKKATIGRIQMSNAEDKDRQCCKPRCKWYMIEA
jgi:hypothetical protein